MQHIQLSRIMRLRSEQPRAKQQGVALAVALILLVVVTLVGLSAIQGTGLQEKMAGNTVDRAQAFQVTQGSLEIASRTLLPPAATPNPSTFNVPGVTDCATVACAENPAIDIPTATAWVPITTKTTSTSNPDEVVSLYGNAPSYIVQYMGDCSTAGSGNFKFTNDENNQGGGGSLQTTSQCYRVTVRGGAASPERSQIVLQAIFRL